MNKNSDCVQTYIIYVNNFMLTFVINVICFVCELSSILIIYSNKINYIIAKTKILNAIELLNTIATEYSMVPGTLPKYFGGIDPS